jgi:serine/threonine protein kinase/formylglycine-generating enzyme required for sulfatase activity
LFDVIICLTATPSKQTIGFFNQNLVMEYTHEEAVADRVNVPYDVYEIQTRITVQGSKVDAGYNVGKRSRKTRGERPGRSPTGRSTSSWPPNCRSDGREERANRERASQRRSLVGGTPSTCLHYGNSPLIIIIMSKPERPYSDQPKAGQQARVAQQPLTLDFPTCLGRYAITAQLGAGGFGVVYKGSDQELRREVAIKVPHRHRIARPEDAEAYLAEARVLAGLDHPHIVPVHDVGRTEDGMCFVVSKFIQGSDLASRIRGAYWQSVLQEGRTDCQSALQPAVAAELIRQVADALHYAHRHGLVHRDIKPGNILLENDAKAYVADFGLALKEDDYGKGPGLCGTPAYMSPEQANGEGHRVDGRSDIFSLGVVFYELLTGRRPFRGDSTEVLLRQIVTDEPRPPRQVDDQVPKELERICLKALAKKASERYTTAKDMAEDLGHFLEGPKRSFEEGVPKQAFGNEVRASLPQSAVPAADPTPPAIAPFATDSDTPIKIVPKGLRSFDAHDADFFLELVPGPRDRDRLPDSIRFWKTRIEETDSDSTFSVGLIYGPSGCGKSSLVKAGLLPRLADNVRAVYIEAAGSETEARLLNALRKRLFASRPQGESSSPGGPAGPPRGLEDAPSGLGLTQTLAALRRGKGVPPGKKVLIVLDQFEQWLHANKEEKNTELVQALRQCDGGRVQCIVMVRDDFWLAVSRFLKELEVRLLEGQNSALVDLFDVDHARKVLAAFGRAFGKLPENSRHITSEQRAFLDHTSAGLAQEGKVVCVRLALFAEMLKGKAWSSSTLKEAGGTEGVGVRFLEETFSAQTAPPEHRYHQKAARAVLKALLPESGTDIKGHMRSYDELLDASGYAGRPKDFDDLICILDSEVRLITPTDPEAVAADAVAADLQSARASAVTLQAAAAGPGRLKIGRHFQLTHDYLVPSLREWLTRKQQEMRRGRAQLLLADRAAVWNARPENRQLPSLVQWLRIRLLTAKKSWNKPERKMMGRATRYHALRGVIATVILLLAGWGSYEFHGHFKARALADTLLTANTGALPEMLKDVGPYRRWLDRLLRDAYHEAERQQHATKQLHASLALLPVDPRQADYLHDRLLTAEPKEALAIRELLFEYERGLPERMWTEVEKSKEAARRLRAACALARFAPGDGRWQKTAAEVAGVLVAQNPSVLETWIEGLKPVADRLLPALAGFLEDHNRSAAERRTIAHIYAKYASGRAEVFARLEQRLQISEVAKTSEALHKLEGALTGKERRKAHEVVLAAGKTYTIDLRSTDFDSYLTLLDPKGKVLAENDDADQTTSHARIIFSATAGGKYQVVATAFENKGAGAYTLTIREGAAQQPQAGSAASLKARAHVASALLAIGRPEKVWPLFKHVPDPSLRSFLIEDAAQVAPEPKLLLDELELLGRIDNPSYESNTSIRRALILTLGGFGAERWPLGERELEVPRFVALYRDDADAGIHAAAEWLLRAWKQERRLNQADKSLMMGKPEGSRRWYLNRQGHTMVIVPPPSGKPRKEKIDWTFAIASTEITQGQFQKCPAFAGHKSFNPSPNNPVENVSWYQAAEYCNWLSAQEGIAEKDWCYLPNQAGEYAAGMKIAPDFLKRKGYRLPTEAEWEHACRAGSVTASSCGDSEELVGRYGWHHGNSAARSQPVAMLRPNDFGLFDMYGNTWEWCQDFVFFAPAPGGKAATENRDVNVLNDQQGRVLRGGSFYDRPGLLRSDARYSNQPAYRVNNYGFRVARTLTSE